MRDCRLDGVGVADLNRVVLRFGLRRFGFVQHDERVEEVVQAARRAAAARAEVFRTRRGRVSGRP